MERGKNSRRKRKPRKPIESQKGAKTPGERRTTANKSHRRERTVKKNFEEKLGAVSGKKPDRKENPRRKELEVNPRKLLCIRSPAKQGKRPVGNENEKKFKKQKKKP